MSSSSSKSPPTPLDAKLETCWVRLTALAESCLALAKQLVENEFLPIQQGLVEHVGVPRRAHRCWRLYSARDKGVEHHPACGLGGKGPTGNVQSFQRVETVVYRREPAP